jgi:hypothetical protein
MRQASSKPYGLSPGRRRGPEGSRPNGGQHEAYLPSFQGLRQAASCEVASRAAAGTLAGTFLGRSRPSRRALAEPARSRIGQLPDAEEGKRPLPERWWSTFDRHLPSESQDLQGNLSSGAGWAAPEEAVRPRTAAGAPPDLQKVPEGTLLDRAGLRPEGRCTLLPSARRPAWQGRRKPKLPRRPLHLVWTRNPKAPDPPSCFSVEPKLLGEGRTAVIRRFHVQEDARANGSERQH